MDGDTGTTGGHQVPPDLPARFMSARDLAELKQIPMRTLYRYLEEGLIPGAERVGPGKKWRINRTAAN